MARLTGLGSQRIRPADGDQGKDCVRAAALDTSPLKDHPGRNLLRHDAPFWTVELVGRRSRAGTAEGWRWRGPPKYWRPARSSGCATSPSPAWRRWTWWNAGLLDLSPYGHDQLRELLVVGMDPDAPADRPWLQTILHQSHIDAERLAAALSLRRAPDGHEG